MPVDKHAHSIQVLSLRCISNHLRQHWCAGGSIDEGRMHMEDSVMKVGVCIGAGSCAQQTLPFLAAQKCDVLNHVSYALLICLLIDTACKTTFQYTGFCWLLSKARQSSMFAVL